MNAEHLLDAMGLLDDQLIQEAEAYRPRSRRPSLRPWMTLAACFAVVMVLGYGLTHMGMGGGNSAAPENSGGAASAPADSSFYHPQFNGTESPAPEAPPNYELQPPHEGGDMDYCAAIMVDGTLYWSTGTPASVEVEERDIRTVNSYINTVPQMDGQTNFSPDLSAQYAQTPEGLVVLIDNEWILFDPIPPWER